MLLSYCCLHDYIVTANLNKKKNVIVVLRSKMFTQLEVFEDSKGVIRIRKSKKDRSHNGQKKKYKRTKNDLQNIQIKLKKR